MTRTAPAFASVVIDVDSTLSRIEGIEWLSSRCDAAIQARVAETTEAAMRGDIPLETVYGERLNLVRPTQARVAALGDAYIAAVAPGAREVISAFHHAGVRVVLVSGGVREAIVPLAQAVGLTDADVCAVSLSFDESGNYAGYDTASPLTRRGGKPDIVKALQLLAPVLAVGDGITDAELKSVVDRFVAFTGVVRHETVVARADGVVTTFAELLPLVFS